MKLNPLQQLHLDKLAALATERRTARVQMEMRIRNEYKRLMEASQTRMDEMVVEGVEMGIPKRQVGIFGLLTKSPNAVYEALARAEHDATLRPVVKVKGSRFVFSKVVKLTRDDHEAFAFLSFIDRENPERVVGQWADYFGVTAGYLVGVKWDDRYDFRYESDIAGPSTFSQEYTNQLKEATLAWASANLLEHPVVEPFADRVQETEAKSSGGFEMEMGDDDDEVELDKDAWGGFEDD